MSIPTHRLAYDEEWQSESVCSFGGIDFREIVTSTSASLRIVVNDTIIRQVVSVRTTRVENRNGYAFPKDPNSPGPVPDDAKLDSKNLHIAQAIELCKRILRDKSLPNSERALAICWLAHLVADAHQPCHAGSLYVAGLFEEGDRGANSIPTKQRGNLHALWDSLLGPKWDAGDIRRRAAEIRADRQVWSSADEAVKAKDGLNPLTWLEESREIGRSHVYTEKVLSAVEAASRANQKLEKLDVRQEYLKVAGQVARKRAAFAAFRLAAILLDGL